VALAMAGVTVSQSNGRTAGLLLIAPLAVFLLLAYAFPVAGMLLESVRPREGGALSLEQYTWVLNSPRTMRAFWRTLNLSVWATVITLAISFPVALLMLRSGPRLKAALLFITFVSLAASLLVRNYGWLVMLADQGPLNRLLMAIGIWDTPQRLVYSEGAILVALVHYALPFMILPIYGALQRIPPSLMEAPASLGASGWAVFQTVVLPLAMPGVFGGTVLAFAVCMSAFVTPLMLGSPSTSMLSQVAADQMLVTLDFARGSAMITLLTVTTFAVVFIYALLLRRVLRIDV
jgi:ABC-type spermidine/putrescine transport system permease subunit I